MSHSRGHCNGRYYFSNGDFSEGFDFREAKGEGESGWFDLKEFFPVVYKAVSSGEFFSFSLKNKNGEYYFTKEECSLIVGHYVDEVMGHISGLSIEEKVNTLKKPKALSELLTVCLSPHQIKELK